MTRWQDVCRVVTFAGLGHRRNTNPRFQPPVEEVLLGDMKTCNLCLPGSSGALGKLELVSAA